MSYKESTHLKVCHCLYRRRDTRLQSSRDRGHGAVSTLAIELQLTGRFHAPTSSALTKSTLADTAWIVVSAVLLRNPMWTLSTTRLLIFNVLVGIQRKFPFPLRKKHLSHTQKKETAQGKTTHCLPHRRRMKLRAWLWLFVVCCKAILLI